MLKTVDGDSELKNKTKTKSVLLHQTNVMPNSNKNSGSVDVNSSLSHMLSLPKALPGYHGANKRSILKYLTCCDLRFPVFVQRQSDENNDLFSVSTWRRLIKVNETESNHIRLLHVCSDLDRKKNVFSAQSQFVCCVQSAAQRQSRRAGRSHLVKRILMCIRSAPSVVSGKQHPLLSRV